MLSIADEDSRDVAVLKKELERWHWIIDCAARRADPREGFYGRLRRFVTLAPFGLLVLSVVGGVSRVKPPLLLVRRSSCNDNLRPAE
jgi:hypothetical protein